LFLFVLALDSRSRFFLPVCAGLMIRLYCVERLLRQRK
jgi:hypothetical protein